VELPFETRLLFLNFSRDQYAALRLRTHNPDNADAPYVTTELLAPGARVRPNFLDLIGEGCPDALDLQILLYDRVNGDTPIGLDEGEVVGASPTVAGELLNVPYCSIQALQGYTVVNWDAPEGTARVKLAQCTLIDQAFNEVMFEAPDFAWEVQGVDPALADVDPPSAAALMEIGGRVALADGTGVEGVGVLLRTQFRIGAANCDGVGEDPNVGFSDPVAFTTTGADGAFLLERPAGAYLLEVFSDDFAFRPEAVNVETELEVITIIAEPIEP
jgi:hypothetical protein